MTSYFDTTNDKTLLPPAYRNHAELANVAVLAESDVIGYFTEDPPYWLYTTQLGLQGFLDASSGTGEDVTNLSAPASAIVPQLRVYLRGYKVDASHANVDPNLKLALKRTIAEVIAWRLNQWTVIEAGMQSVSGQEGGVPKSKSFRPGAEEAFPPDWTRRLYPYDSRKLPWGW